jgi:sulfatase maturation enzyme AslB (radical SAM superfamily)
MAGKLNAMPSMSCPAPAVILEKLYIEYNMTFCFSPWSNIDISPTGRMSPCCKFQTAEAPNIKDTSLAEYASSPWLTTVREQFINGEWPKECERCKIEEQSGIASKRELDYTRWEHHYRDYDLTSDQFITGSISFGNTCNLKCITCNADTSSKWYKESIAILDHKVDPVKFYRNNFVEEFVARSPDIKHLDITGGEPLISGVDEQKKLLRHYIDTGRASSTTLHYTTNLTLFPDDEWWNIWQHFLEVDIQLSIDGVGKRYEYIRYPASWNTLESVLDLYLIQFKQQSNIKLSISHTVSAYNIWYLDEFFDWCDSKGLPKPWLGRVHNPAHMRPSVWPAAVRDKIKEHLEKSKYHDVQAWASLLHHNDDSKHFELFKTRLMAHDQYRGLSFNNTFEELGQFL